MELRTILCGIFLVIGCFFMLVSAVGVIRFPDFYSRIHPAGKSDTMGQAMVIVGLIIYEGFTFVSIKLLMIIAFIFIAHPTATHAIARAAHASGLRAWSREEKDE